MLQLQEIIYKCDANGKPSGELSRSPVAPEFWKREGRDVYLFDGGNDVDITDDLKGEHPKFALVEVEVADPN